MINGGGGALELRQQFLHLLVAQLQNQDPIDPVQQENFLGQLAQFATLESVEALNTSFGDLLAMQELAQGTELLGKRVTFSENGGPEQSGVVEAVRTEASSLVVQVAGRYVSIHDVIGVAAQV